MNLIEREVLKKIVPSNKEKEQIKEIIDSLKKDFFVHRSTYCKKKEIEPTIVGSVAKGTHLSGTDIDVFLLFPPDVPREKLEKEGLEIGKKILPEWEIRYAEHPYIRGKYGGFGIDIVPCYKVDSPEEMISSVDRTPFHTKYVLDNLPKEKRNEVRLLKRFLKGIECYGAEAKIEGFSGYLCELLIIKYGSFRSLLENAGEWKDGLVLSLKDRGESFDAPLTFIDPVDPKRNVASALSKEKLDLFILAARKYIRKPAMEFFFPNESKSLSLKEIDEAIKGKHFVGIEIERPDIIDDILYPQIRKGMKAIIDLCEEYDFIINNAGFYSNEKVVIALELPRLKLSTKKLHRGPPVIAVKHAKHFLEKWRENDEAVGKPFKRNGRWWVEIKRKHASIQNLLEEKLGEIDMGKHLKEKNFEILVDKELVKKRYEKFWTKYLNDQMPWEI